MMLRSHCICFSWILQYFCSEGNLMCKFLNFPVAFPTLPFEPLKSQEDQYLVVDTSEVFVQVVTAVSYRSCLKGHRLFFRKF